jgi:hypothetical protein
LAFSAAANGPAGSGQRAAAAAALSAALRRDAACLFDAVGRVAAMQAAARSARGAAPGGSATPPAGAGPYVDACKPGFQLYALLTLAVHALKDGPGPDRDAFVKSFARSRAAVAATLEALLHDCPGMVAPGNARSTAARVLSLVCAGLTSTRHLRGAFASVVPAVVQRLGRGAPGSTLNERLFLVQVLQVRYGRARRAGGKTRGGARMRAAAADPPLDAGRAARFCWLFCAHADRSPRTLGSRQHGRSHRSPFAPLPGAANLGL